jgi:Insertion element 4 transposase N-terminal
MPKLPTRLPDGTRPSDKITFGYFTSVFPKTEIKSALRDLGRQTIRNRELPNELVVYFVMMLALFREASQQEVLRLVFECVQWLFGPQSFKIMARSAISQARSRVGWEPFKQVFHRVAKPLSALDDRHSSFKGLRVIALDGSLFDVMDSAENQVFGRAVGPHGPGAYPQARLVSFVECGTHAIFRSEVGGYKDSEQALARKLFPHLTTEMICLADRNFLGANIFSEAASTGAMLLWRATKTFKLIPEKALKDGSFLTTMYAYDDPKHENPVQVRVVEYSINGNQGESIRLVTNWLDERQAPAMELACLYHERWEYESAMDEVKVHLGANQLVLRSQKPDLVIQELYATAMAHYAVRKVMHEAAVSADLDDDDLSFTHSLRIIRRRLPMFGNFSPGKDNGGDPQGDLANSRLVEPQAV